MLRVDVARKTATLAGPSFDECGGNKWQNGYYSQRDRAVYGIPCNADGVLRIDVSSVVEDEGEAVITKEGDLGLDPEKWEGGVVGRDGNMYCVPQMSDHVLRIVPAKQGSQ